MADYIEVTLAAVNNCSVIADWDLEHVWELLMACEEKRGGPYRTFTKDFDWCLELYKEANEGMCAIITGDGGNKAACGSRFGCAWCTVTGEKDKSMEAMIASAPEKHAHMSGVNLFRNYLINTRWDMGKRDWLGRTYSDAGYISVTATAYSAAMRRELLRYLLTLDVLEEERAEEHDARMYRGELEDTEYNQTLRGVTFQFITPQQLVAIDFAWSLSYGFDHAFPALTEWYEIRVLGKRYPIPDIAPMDVDTADALLFVDDFDEEFYELAKTLELTNSAKFYLNRGLVKLGRGKAADYDEMARRAQYWNRLQNNLGGTDLRSFVRHHSISDKEHTKLLETLKAEAEAKAEAESQVMDLFA